MKYAIIKCINGNYFVHSEGITTTEAAMAQFHAVCQSLWNASDVVTATVAVVNETLDIMPPYYKEVIDKTPAPEPEPEPEPTPEPEVE